MTETAGQRPLSTIRALGLIALLLLSALPTVSRAAAETTARLNVLVLLDQSPLLPRNQKILEGMYRASGGSNAGMTVWAEYTQLDEIDADAFRRLHAHLTAEYGTDLFDVVVASWIPEAAYAREYWPDLPLINLSPEPMASDRHQLDLEVDLLTRIERTLVMATALNGDPGACVIIRGDLPADSAVLDAFAERLRDSGCRGVRTLDSRSVDELSRELALLGADDMVFFLPFSFDDNGQSVIPREYIVRLSEASGAPIFGFHAQMLGRGIVGGDLVRPDLLGEAAGRAIREYGERGAFLSRLPTSGLAIDQEHFDRFFKGREIPGDAVVINRPPPFLSETQVRGLLLVTASLLFGVLVLSLTLASRVRALRRANHDLSRAERELELANRNLLDHENALLASQKIAHLGHYVYTVANDHWSSSEELNRVFGIDADYPRSSEDWLALVHEEDREGMRRYLADEVIGAGRHFDREYRVADRRTGEVKWVHGLGDLARDAAGNPTALYGTIQDITERRRMDEALRHAIKMDAVGQMAGGIAHDFNNVLGIISGHLGKIGKDPTLAAHAASLEVIGRALTRAGNLSRKLLVFARGSEHEVEVVDLNRLVSEVSELVQKSMTPLIEVRYDLEPEPWYCEISGGDFTDSLINLLNNARDAIAVKGRITIRTRNVCADDSQPVDTGKLIGQGSLPAGDYACLTVADTGSGIAESDLNRIFEPFYTTKEISRGSGLGLPMVYGFVTRSHGYIGVESKPGEGATFRIFLPKTERSPPETTPVADDPVEARDQSLGILVVDDEPELLSLSVEALESSGHRVFAAGSATEALTVLDRQPDIDLLITDILMPGGMDGLELAREVSMRIPGIDIVFVSGHFNRSDLPGDLADVSIVLQKPFTDHDLLQAVDRAVDNRPGSASR